ncbi:MAG TPA: apolipoprotein N-acyltransferase [Acidimicrobiales bacterium]|nr:apolipoprotein N-acyltransferase [Acidimicrobiales bacterium]
MGPSALSRAPKLAGRAALALLAGGLIGCSLPPFGPWWLAPLGLTGAAWIISGQPVRARALSGFLVGAGQFTIGCVWALEFTGLGYVTLVVFEACFVAAACAAVPPRRGRILAFAGSLSILEWGRDRWPFGGLPIGSTAWGQAGGPLAGLARVGGPLLIVVALSLAGAGLAVLASAAWARLVGARSFPWRNALAGLAAAGLVVLVSGLAAWAPDGGPPHGVVSVAIAQGGGRRGIGSLATPSGRVYAATWRVTSGVRPPVSLVVWPEDTVPLAGPLAGSPKAQELAALARRLDTTLLAGVTSPVGSSRFRNEIVAWGPSGRILGSVEKNHPVPFGEYVPWRPVFSRIAGLTAIPRDVIVGDNDGELATPAGRVAILNSFEAFFADRARQGVRAGGELLVVETNTASYSSDVIPAAELAASRLEAIALGRDLVQSATTGYSAVIRPDGVVALESELGSPDLLETSLALRTGATLYERFGDLPVLVGSALLVALGWAMHFGGFSRRPAHGARRRRRTPARFRRAA